MFALLFFFLNINMVLNHRLFVSFEVLEGFESSGRHVGLFSNYLGTSPTSWYRITTGKPPGRCFVRVRCRAPVRPPWGRGSTKWFLRMVSLNDGLWLRDFIAFGLL